ncbi:DUF2180 family protein [Alicyclobacillus sp. SO9]|uniref:DUF2180 family protein n=1 Tax=Alicyclobacillus sp. SO9 TaxID=2665646 RepID=UPI0018E782CE|nr:DUF2180 family protein [Alicyclobacillus sp. SO9]QQE81610.1 DUF2180 family protein [Alicyclobacillus sp. SO9]
MKCSKHNDTDAVSQCIDCGRGLCTGCTNKFSIPICDQCELSRIQADRKTFVRNIVIMIVLFVVGLLAGQGFFERILEGYFFAGIPWGWNILTRITPRMFLFMSWMGWIFYFAIKLFLAMIIGMFVTPYQIYRVISGLKQAKKMSDYTEGTLV